MSPEDLVVFAAQHYPELEGKLIPAGVLVAYLFAEHEHLDDEGGRPVVDSVTMEKFIRDWTPPDPEHLRIAEEKK